MSPPPIGVNIPRASLFLREKNRTAVVCGKLCTAPEGDYFVVCSFNPDHVILRSRMPYHIIKCVKNYPDHKKLQCPYDATEYIDPEDFPSHIRSCESKRSIYSDKYEIAQLKASGNMCNIKQTPFFHNYVPVEDEDDWGGTPTKDDEDLPLGRIEGVGRGISLNKPKKGMGRAEILKHIYQMYQEKQSSSSSNSSLMPSESTNSLRENVTSDQFDDDWD